MLVIDHFESLDQTMNYFVNSDVEQLEAPIDTHRRRLCVEPTITIEEEDPVNDIEDESSPRSSKVSGTPTPKASRQHRLSAAERQSRRRAPLLPHLELTSSHPKVSSLISTPDPTPRTRTGVGRRQPNRPSSHQTPPLTPHGFNGAPGHHRYIRKKVLDDTKSAWVDENEDHQDENDENILPGRRSAPKTPERSMRDLEGDFSAAGLRSVR